MITRYDSEIEGITFQEPPPVSRFLEGLGGSGGPATEYDGLTRAQLAAMYNEGRLPEAAYRDELQARGDGAAAIEEQVRKNKPEAGVASGPQQIAPPSFEGAAGVADPRSGVQTSTSLKSLSATDIIKGVKDGLWSAEEAYKALIQDKGYSQRAAEAELQLGLGGGGDGISPEMQALASQLETRGLGPNLSEQEIMMGAEYGFWSPDEAFQGLQAFQGMSPQEASSILQMRGWSGGGQPLAEQAGQQPNILQDFQPTRSFEETTGNPYESEAERAWYLQEAQGRGGNLGGEALGFLQNQGLGQQITPPRSGSGGLVGLGGGGGGNYNQDAAATLYDAASKAGFTGDALHRAVATALAESGGNFGANNTKGEDSRGPWQINVGAGAHPQLAGVDLYDPYIAAKEAYRISSGGKDWSPWSVWHQNVGAPAQPIYSGLVGLK